MKKTAFKTSVHRVGYEAPDAWVGEAVTEESFLSFELPGIEEEEEEW